MRERESDGLVMNLAAFYNLEMTLLEEMLKSLKEFFFVFAIIDCRPKAKKTSNLSPTTTKKKKNDDRDETTFQKLKSHRDQRCPTHLVLISLRSLSLTRHSAPPR